MKYGAWSTSLDVSLGTGIVSRVEGKGVAIFDVGLQGGVQTLLHVVQAILPSGFGPLLVRRMLVVEQ